MDIGARELIWVVVGLLFVYVAYQLYRVFNLGRGQRGKGSAGAASPETTAARPELFQVELEVQQLRRDLAQLRNELTEQRNQVSELQRGLAEANARFEQARKERTEPGAGGPGISPEYGEALVFARRGFDVEAIAERCGITVAEAQLVCAIARRGQGEPGEGA